MNILIDTHTFLWFVNGDSALSATARRFIDDESNEIFLSIASAWEMAIKDNLGRLELPKPVAQFVEEQLTVNDMRLLNVSLPHIAKVATLPHHYNDRFDRMLIAQALVDELGIVSVDAALTDMRFPVW